MPRGANKDVSQAREKACIHCGRVFQRPRAIPNEGWRRRQFCSMTCRQRPWSSEEDAILRTHYTVSWNQARLSEVATRLDRSLPAVHARARELGLSNRRHTKPWRASIWKRMDETDARRWFEKFRKVKRGSVLAWCRKMKINYELFGLTMRQFFPAEWEALIELRQPKTTLYRLGRAFEYRVRDELQGLGYFVMRAAGSRSPIDLIAVRKGAVLFVQCKMDGYLRRGEWNDLFELAESVGVVPLLAGRWRRSIRYCRLLSRKEGITRGSQPYGVYQPEYA